MTTATILAMLQIVGLFGWGVAVGVALASHPTRCIVADYGAKATRTYHECWHHHPAATGEAETLTVLFDLPLCQQHFEHHSHALSNPEGDPTGTWDAMPHEVFERAIRMAAWYTAQQYNQ
jgi:hypothetical protein